MATITITERWAYTFKDAKGKVLYTCARAEDDEATAARAAWRNFINESAHEYPLPAVHVESLRERMETTVAE